MNGFVDKVPGIESFIGEMQMAGPPKYEVPVHMIDSFSGGAGGSYTNNMVTLYVPKNLDPKFTIAKVKRQEMNKCLVDPYSQLRTYTENCWIKRGREAIARMKEDGALCIGVDVLNWDNGHNRGILRIWTPKGRLAVTYRSGKFHNIRFSRLEKLVGRPISHLGLFKGMDKDRKSDWPGVTIYSEPSILHDKHSEYISWSALPSETPILYGDGDMICSVPMVGYHRREELIKNYDWNKNVYSTFGNREKFIL